MTRFSMVYRNIVIIWYKDKAVRAIINMKRHVTQKREKTANVIALLEGSDPDLKDEYLVIGGHYDQVFIL